MSTRSEIVIKETYNWNGSRHADQLKLYHHFDGYPEGVGKFLIENVLPLIQKGNPSISYIANFLIKSTKDDGYEVTLGKHVDIEYFYEINLTKRSIKCWSAHYKSGKDGIYRLNKTKEENLERFLPLDITNVYA